MCSLLALCVGNGADVVSFEEQFPKFKLTKPLLLLMQNPYLHPSLKASPQNTMEGLQLVSRASTRNKGVAMFLSQGGIVMNHIF